MNRSRTEQRDAAGSDADFQMLPMQATDTAGSTIGFGTTSARFSIWISNWIWNYNGY